MASEDNGTWFHRIADDFAKRVKLEAVTIEDGPNAFRVHYGKGARGKPLYELSIDFVRERAALLTRDVSYGEVAQVFHAGQQEQFSPFDDGPGRPTRLDIRAWLEQRCQGKPMID